MSNDIFEKLYEQFSLMIKSFIKKYKGLLEEDEIHQCCCLGIMKAYNTYEDNRNTKFSNWIYQNMEWQILRELRGIKHQDRYCKSLQSTLFDGEGQEITIEDTIQDDTVDIEAEIEYKLMMNYYESECRRVLGNDFEVAYLRWFKNMPYNTIESILSTDKAAYKVDNCRRKLIQKSRVFHDEYMKIIGIDDYKNPEAAII